MLETLRKHSRSFLIKLVLWGVVVSFVLTIFLVWGRGREGFSGNPDAVVQIDDTLIDKKTFLRLYRNQLSQIKGGLSGEQGRLIKRLVASQVLNGLINQELLVAEAERLGLLVTEEEISDRILNDYGFKVEGEFIGEKQYQEILSRYGYTVSEFEQAVTKELLAGNLQNLLIDSVVVTPEEVRWEFIKRNEQVRISYILVSADGFLPRVKVSDKQLSLYFEQNKERYRLPEMRKLAFLILTEDKFSFHPTVSDEEIERYYERNINNFRTPEERRASHILFRLSPGASAEGRERVKIRMEKVLAEVRAGGDFAELARKYSEDEGTRDLGGDLGFIKQGNLLPELDQALFNIMPGEVSDIIETSAGYHILKLNEIKRSSYKSVTDPEVRSIIREAIRDQKKRTRLTNLAKEIKTVAGDTGDLSQALSSLNLKDLTVETTEFFSQDKSIEHMGIAFPAAEAAFSLKKDELSDPIPLRNGFAIVKLLDIKPSSIPPLAEVKNKAAEDLKLSQAKKLAHAEARKLTDEAKRRGDLALPGKEVAEAGPATRAEGFGGELADAPVLTKKAFSLKEGEIAGPIPVSKGYAVIKITEKKKPGSEEFLAARDRLAEQLTNERQLALINSVITRLRNEAEIIINNELLEKIIGD